MQKKSPRHFHKLGIVLAGGGGKGAYQVGVFRALVETGLIHKIQVIAGTSVGALNAVLYAHKNLELSEYIWLSRIEDKILYKDKRKLERDWHHWKRIWHEYQQEKGTVSLRRFVSSRQIPFGVFSRDGLSSIFNEEIDWELVFQSGIDLFAIATSVEEQKSRSFHLNTYSRDDITKILLASSAIPGVFNPVLIEGSQYYDGGLYENLPIDTVYQAGCDLILTIPLFRSLDRVKLKSNYPHAHIIELMPENSLNGLSGILDFSPKSVRSLMQAGYEEHITLLRAVNRLFDIDAPSKD
ncbi:patatin-like phospholipase family protein [Entomospira entomophila]|uniref:PNPLA domain-containing protein n=1 Tax=Entomospira entomophila TaxID=2719988 RepID=A0A968GCK5_9SPIO|nr:patatin-like phospholipase family protein [Entomospira entomophilus]NIZ40946.1 hypothetical protein [Entomospira entomophilus]WDI35159.1 patatin-like phospholipase family protein [Entomospira entomophilus]